MWKGSFTTRKFSRIF